jgi:RNA recognition motif-containing protein
MAKSIYVGNLSYSADEDSLRELFEKMGEVLSAKIITDAETGRSRGFAFVEMASDEDAENAISALNGTTFMDRPIVVNEARPRADKGPGRGKKRSNFRRGRDQDNWRYR